MTDKIFHRELSYLVNGCIYDVHNEVGPGLREECYQKALEHRLIEKGIPFIAKPWTRREFVYRHRVVDSFVPDLVVADRLVPELKHQPEGLANENFTQVLSYLKFWQLNLGLLVNFAMDRAIIKRVPFVPCNAIVEENYDEIANVIQSYHRPILQTLREGVLELHRTVGVGYPTTTCRNLALVEWQSRGLDCLGELNVEPTFHERRLPRSNITPFLIEKSVGVQVDAIYDGISARAVRTLQTHLRLMDCKIGLVVCFGKSKLLIRGVRR